MAPLTDSLKRSHQELAVITGKMAMRTCEENARYTHFDITAGPHHVLTPQTLLASRSSRPGRSVPVEIPFRKLPSPYGAHTVHGTQDLQ